MLPTIATGNVASALAGEYEVANSLRFDDGSSDYLNRTPASAGNRKTWTYSTWVKRANLVDGRLTSCFSAQNDTDNIDILFSSNAIRIVGWTTVWRITNRLFRDVSAWYHIVVSVDTTQSTANDRIKVYINGVEETSFSTTNNPSQNADIGYNQASTTRIGSASNAVGGIFDGYMAETVFIDGQQLDPTSFGEFDSDTNIWKPIDVSGLTFGTNGFYLDFENSGSLGADVSGNGNNFTVNNLTSADQTTDTCTNNFATLNPLDVSGTSIGTFSQGNTYGQSPNTSPEFIGRGTLAVSSGKWYWEAKCVSIDVGSFNNFVIGIDNINSPITNSGYIGSTATSYSYAGYSGNKFNNNSGTSFGSTLAVNDIVGVALDMDNGFIYFSKNGVWQNSGDPTSGASGTGSAFSSISGTYTPAFSDQGSSVSLTIGANFGNPAFTISSGNSDGNGYGNFEFAVPSEYYALNTKNLAEFG